MKKLMVVLVFVFVILLPLSYSYLTYKPPSIDKMKDELDLIASKDIVCSEKGKLINPNLTIVYYHTVKKIGSSYIVYKDANFSTGRRLQLYLTINKDGYSGYILVNNTEKYPLTDSNFRRFYLIPLQEYISYIENNGCIIGWKRGLSKLTDVKVVSPSRLQSLTGVKEYRFTAKWGSANVEITTTSEGIPIKIVQRFPEGSYIVSRLYLINDESS